MYNPLTTNLYARKHCFQRAQCPGLHYLSWAWAWQIVKAHFPNATYTIYENPDGWNYFTDGKTCWVKTGVTIEGLEHIEYLPVMDARNQSIPHYAVTSTDVNKSIQRSLTKACARHGLGLYIYAGEDLPDSADAEQPQRRRTQRTSPVQQQDTPPPPTAQDYVPSWRQSRSQYVAGK